MQNIKLAVILLFSLFYSTISYAQNVTNYLILQDIGSYKFSTQSVNPITDEVSQVPGYIILKNAGVLIGTGHFRLDHKDISYETDYESDVADLGVEVQVTQHAGVDSDKWLLHEVEDNYRDDETETLGQLTDGVVMRRVDNKRVLWLGIGGGTFRWVSNNVVISVSYTDLQGTKPEPIEVVKAYLSKYPSTITVTDAEFKSKAYNVKWIKDEMERRLWLCDKWLMQLQLGKVSQKDTLDAMVKHMNVFLNYRQKYYSVTATEDISALNTALRASDGTTIKNKLATYKTWWSANKTKSISL